MAETRYERRGAILLTRPPKALPTPAPGELEAIEAAAARFGFMLKEFRIEGMLKHAIEDLLGQGEHRKLMAAISVPEGRSYYDFETLDFWDIPDLAKIKLVYEFLPGFLRELNELDGISAEVNLELKDLVAQAPTIRLDWDATKEELTWTETPAEQVERITEAELYRRQSEQWAREHPDE